MNLLYQLIVLGGLWLIFVTLRWLAQRARRVPVISKVFDYLGCLIVVPIALPVMIVFGVLLAAWMLMTWPYRLAIRFLFALSMRRCGRTIDWEQFKREVEQGHGTLLIEEHGRHFWTEVTRTWWTAEDVYSLSPKPLIDWYAMSRLREYDALLNWFEQRYTGPNGSALLVLITNRTKKSLVDALLLYPLNGIHWVEIGPAGRHKEEADLASRWEDEGDDVVPL